jgi:deoxycytidylate deaminase
MNTHVDDILDLAAAVATRSTCHVQVGAVIADRQGRIVAWGWNHAGSDGLGMCAERAAIRRANRRRLPGSTLVIVARRRGREICSLPCKHACARAIQRAGIARVSAVGISGDRFWYPVPHRRTA